MSFVGGNPRNEGGVRMPAALWGALGLAVCCLPREGWALDGAGEVGGSLSSSLVLPLH